ncbi:MAG: PKD domain-containing protein [Bacteroidetes bacterium]|nr:MAG: PKD domain-containing protein [Bacteroidota bacterium]MBL1145395.1 PKD domain-containing protein [Bacteroidota bacterium]
MVILLKFILKNCFKHQFIWFFIPLIFICNLNSYSQTSINSIIPINGNIVFEHEIEFKWNKSFFESNNSYYILKIANDSALSNIVYTSVNLSSRFVTYRLTTPSKYYWQVEHYESGILTDKSGMFMFNYIDIHKLNNLSLFLDPDSGVTINGNNQIQKWLNLADTSNSAIQLTLNQQPILIVDTSLEDRKIIKFDGTDDLLQLNSSLLLSDVFTIANWGGSESVFPSYNGLITGQTSNWVFAGLGTGSTNLDVTTSFNNYLINNILSINFAPLQKFKLLNAQRNSASPLNLSNMNLGRNRTSLSRYWNGSMGDIIGFNTKLNDSLRNIVNQYYCQKYSKPLSLEEDILVTNRFCDTLYRADSIYLNYLWSNGDTTSYSLLTPGNSYQLTVTNEFGCVFTDEISVNINVFKPKSQTLCMGDTIVWDLKLPNSKFNFLWSDGSTDSSLVINDYGNYFVSITDSNGCLYKSDTLKINYDSSLKRYTLGADTTLCKGNTISLLEDSSIINSYLWSTGNTNNSQRIDTSGIYTLRIGNGQCFKNDTINITIKGEAPLVGFTTTNTCFLDSVHFFDTTTVVGGINLKSWTWNFGDGTTSNIQNPIHFYDSSGLYIVEYKVMNDSNCFSTVLIPLEIHPKPEASFTYTNNCESDSTSFTDSSIISSGAITKYLWNFGDNTTLKDTSNSSNPKYKYAQVGSYSVQLTIASNYGCLDTTIKLINIKDSPHPSFTYLNTYKDDSVKFINNTTINSGTITNYNWDFGNSLYSTKVNPKTLYSQIGKYEIALHATSNLGCTNKFIDSIEITLRPPPIPEFNTVLPKLNQVLEKKVDFLWNMKDSSTSYRFQLAKDSAFLNIITDVNFLIKPTFSQKVSQGSYFWRVFANKKSIIVDTTNTGYFHFIDIKNVDSLSLWLVADTGVVDTNGYVINWKDLSNSNIILNTPNSSNQTQVLTNGLNGYNLVNFDTGKDFFQNILNINKQNYFISAVYNFQENTSRPSRLISGQNNWNLGPYYNHRVYNSSGFVNIGLPIIKDQFVVNTAHSINDTLFQLVNDSLLGYSNVGSIPGILSLGANHPISYFNGSIAEIIMVNGSINKDEGNRIQNYLMDKYSPPVNLGSDRYVCSYPQTLSAYKDSYLAYMWNTGSTDSVITIDSSGKYLVTVTDMFNRRTVDSMFFILDTFNFKVDLISEDSTLCLDNEIEIMAGRDNLSYSWNTNENTPSIIVDSNFYYKVTVTNCLGILSTDSIRIRINNPKFSLGNDTTVCFNIPLKVQADSAFNNVSYLWSDGTSNDFITINLSNQYALTVTDQYNCSYSDTIKINVDSSLYGLTLGPDTSLCVGNEIALLNPNSSINTYAWSNNAITPSTLIDSSGNYKVTVSSSRCTVSDSINILIKGFAPEVNFSFTNTCIGNSIFLTDSTIAPIGDTLKKWSWELGDNTILNSQNISHLYTQDGNYTVILKVTTDKGCTDTISKVITIYPRPKAKFKIVENVLCAKSLVNFTDQSTISSGSFKNYSWNFGDTNSLQNTSTIKNPSHIYDTLGHYPIRLIAESNFGCIDSITKIKYINPTPNIQFDIDGTCLGDSTNFYDKTILPKGQINSYLWAFNWLPTPSGNQTSFDKNPSLYIPLANEVKVTLRVITDSTCQATIRDTFQIHHKPIANFNSLENCFNLPFQIQNSSSIIGDSIVSYQYVFDNKDTSYLENPIFSKNAIGTFDLELKIKSSNECYDSITKPIRVHELPIPNFKILNNNTGVPFKIEVLNTSSKASKYTWLFRNGAVSHDAIPNYVYLDTGVYNLQLKAESAYGCVDSLIKQIYVLPYFLDAAISNVFLTEDNKGYLNIGVQYLNSGNNTINQIEFIADVNSNAKFSESFNEIVFSGNQSAVQFSNSYIQANSNKVNYVCIKIGSVNNILDDDFTNNELCKQAFNENLYLTVFPNPTSSLLYFNYVLPNDGSLTLNLYDQMGRKVVNQIDKNQTTGVYKLAIDMSSLKPGIYHYDFIFNGTRRSGEIIKN